ncbi:glycosyltransferase family 9 protein [Streptomyces massasporeus]|uniref:glycosyltransferase family 9 protein n=1 Tax=Streptomyces massasporeus TaxID=67324 RepID=UPI0036F6F7FF
MGDLVQRNIFLKLLRDAHPHATVTLVVGESIARAYRTLLTRHGYADHLLVCPDPVHGTGSPQLPPAFLHTLREREFDLCLVDPDSIGLDAAHAHAAGIPHRVALPKGGPGDAFITRPVRLPPPLLGRTDLYEYATGLAGALGLPTPLRAATVVPPFPYTPGADPFPPGDGLRVVIHPGGAPHWNRRWPAERYAELCDRLSAAGARVALTGSADERGELEALRDTCTPAGERPHVLPFDGLDAQATALASAHLVVGNDSGPAHIAAALRVPTVVIYGPTATEYLWSRIYPLQKGVSLRYPCRTLRRSAHDPEAARCDRGCATAYSPGGGYPRCLTDLDVATVWSIVADRLGIAHEREATQ